LDAKNVTGDVGEKISAGEDKEIIWDLVADNIFLKETINVKLVADVKRDFSYYSFNKLLISSIIVPGMGRHKFDRSKKQYYAGMIGYTCILTGLVTKSSSNKSFNRYSIEKDAALRQKYFNRSNTYRSIATLTFISAASIWATDITLLYLKKLNSKSTASNFQNNLNFAMSYNYFSQKPMFGLNYRF